MAYTPELEPHENLALQTAFQISDKSEPFHFAVSDQAIYWPRKKLIAMTDPFYFERIRTSAISEVCVRRLRPYGLWIVAALMIFAGLVTAYFTYAPLIDRQPGEHRVSGWPIAILVGGILIPIAARGRLGLEVKTHDKTYRWKPPLVIGQGSKQKIQALFDEIIAACERSGLRVMRD